MCGWNADRTQNKDECLAHNNGCVERYEKVRTKLLALQETKQYSEQKADKLSGFMFVLHEREQTLTEFDDYLCAETMDTITVHSDGRLVFNLKNGMCVEGWK